MNDDDPTYLKDNHSFLQNFLLFLQINFGTVDDFQCFQSSTAFFILFSIQLIL